MEAKPRIQFGLRGVFAATSAACGLLAVAATWPRIAVITFPTIGGCTAIMATLAIFDTGMARRETLRAPAWGSWGLIAVSVCTLLVMAACYFLPGGAGTVQYTAGSELAEAVFQLRVITMLMFVTGPIACGMVGIVRGGDGFRAHPGWMIAAVGTYVAAWVVLVKNTWFIPMM